MAAVSSGNMDYLLQGVTFLAFLDSLKSPKLNTSNTRSRDHNLIKSLHIRTKGHSCGLQGSNTDTSNQQNSILHIIC